MIARERNRAEKPLIVAEIKIRLPAIVQHKTLDHQRKQLPEKTVKRSVTLSYLSVFKWRHRTGVGV